MMLKARISAWETNNRTGASELQPHSSQVRNRNCWGSAGKIGQRLSCANILMEAKGGNLPHSLNSSLDRFSLNKEWFWFFFFKGWIGLELHGDKFGSPCDFWQKWIWDEMWNGAQLPTIIYSCDENKSCHKRVAKLWATVVKWSQFDPVINVWSGFIYLLKMLNDLP